MERLILPEIPPSVNHMYENQSRKYRDKEGKIKSRRMRLLTPEAQKWMDNTVIITNLWRVKNKWTTYKGKVIVRLWFFFPYANHIDTHNGLKGLLDAFEDALIYENDRTALPQIMDYQIDRDNPRLEVEFEKVMEDDKTQAGPISPKKKAGTSL